MSQPPSAIRSTVVVSITRLLSALLALILGMYSARYFGTSMSKDCYVVAQAIAMLATTVLLGGIWGSLLVTLAEIGREGGVRAQRAFARGTLAQLAAVLLPLSLVLTVFPEPLMRLAAPGFDAAKLALAADLFRVTVWGVFGLAAFTVVRCLFETSQDFIVPTSVSLLMPIVSLVVLITLVGRSGIFALPLGSLLGMLLATPLLGLLARRRLKDPPGFAAMLPSPEDARQRRRAFWVAFVPMSLGANTGQINLLVDNAFASYLPTGNITMLGFAFVILANAEQLTVLSLSEVAFPRLVAAGLDSDDELGRALRATVRAMVLVTAPIATGMIAFGAPLARLLFERGEFPPSSTLAVARLLGWYSLEIVFVGCLLALSRVLIARKRFAILAAISTGAIAANVMLDYALMKVLGVNGIALATTLVALVQCLAIAPFARRETGRLGEPGLGRFLAKVLASAMVMGTVVFAWSLAFERTLGTEGTLRRLLHVASGLAVGAGVYAGLVYALRVQEARDLLRRFWRRA